MKANSDTYPERFIKSRGKTFFNFNIVESQIEEEGSIRIVFNYEYVEVQGKDRTSLIRAILNDRYTLEDEIAIINNYSRDKDKYAIEYDAYQSFRDGVKDRLCQEM